MVENNDLCSPLGCASAMFCMNGGLNNTMDGVPAYITRTYATPKRLSAIKKRQSTHQTFVKRKNTKLDIETTVSRNLDQNGMEIPDGSSLSRPNVSATLPPHSEFSESLGSIENSKPSRSRRIKNSGRSQDKRRSLMENHFGAANSLIAKSTFVQNPDGGLQTPRSVVFRSSSTACISPVRRTEEFLSPPIYFKASSRINSPLNDSSNIGFSHDAVFKNLFNSPIENLDSSGSRRRSKSFGNKEALIPTLSLAKVDSSNYSSVDLSENSLNNCDSTSKLSSGTSSSECSSGNQSSNILTDSTNLPTDRVKNKLKAARSKLKGSKSLSKSLHSLFPLGCTGSLTLQHGTTSDCVDAAIYQPIHEFETRYQTNELSLSPQHDSALNSKSMNRSKTMKAIKTYTKRKSLTGRYSDMAKLYKSQPSLATQNDNDHIFNNHNNQNTLSETNPHPKLKGKKKSLNKSHLFSCVGTKDLWYNKLAQVIAEEKEISPASANIQVSFYDQTTNADICKTVTISSNTNARECIGITLDHLEMRDADVSKFQLWVKTSSDDAPYPLIGHEFPLSIKYNCVRDNFPDCDNNNISNTGIESKCQFILRQDRKVGLTASMAPENGGKKVSKKARKSPIRIHKVFKRSNSKGDSLDGPAPSGILFGHPLSKLYDNNNGSLPKPVMEMLSQIFQKGPFTVGIFRKSANARQVREMREKLDSGCPVDLTNTNITAVAALFKEYLRTLPDALLCSQLYDEWLEIPRLPTVREQISKTLLLCSRLHKSNLLLLQHFFCILHHISRRSSTNMMSASNLAVCVGPSLLWPSSPVLAFTPEDSKQAPSIMEFLIDRFGEIFGEAMLRLMGDAPETDPSRQDSGAEESDSLHSGHSLHSCNGRRDDSSIDSLERDLLEGELSPLPRKDKMSLTNLSRDSGLTMSDTQLYTPDEEESESTSSGHSSADKNMGYSSERVQHYPAPNNPNAIYTAICRRSEKSSPTYEDHENYYATPSREHTRVHITYSTPSYTSAPRMNGSSYPEGAEDIAGSRMNYDEESIYSIPSADNSCHFQRGDWMRKKSNLRKVSKTNSNEGALTRSTSEESLLNKYNTHDYGVSLSAGGPASGRRSPSEDCLRSPTQTEFSEEMSFSRDSAIRRSRSAHYLAEVRREKLKDNSSNDLTSPISRSSSQDAMTWLRSKSTPHIQEEGDRSYDSSTLSDDDSTPHISRSNSRGKEYTNSSTNCWENSLQHTDSSNSRNSSFKSERTSSVCTVISAGSCSTLSSIPPSYEEALNRKSLMQQNQYNDSTIREELIKSAKAKQLYQSSLKIYQEGGNYGDIVRASPAHAHDSDEIDCPPPLPPKGDPPPLPPKQRSIRRVSNDSSSRLKHLPPVHVDTQSSPRTHKSKDKATVHKTIIYTNMSPTGVNPKERTVIEVVDRANDSHRSDTQSVVSSIEKKNIETQTDDIAYEDDDDLHEDEIDDWQTRPHVTSVHVPDSSQKTRRRGRARRRDSSSSQRSRSVPSRGDNGAVLQSEESESEETEDWDYVVPNLSRFGNLDSELRDEISWSVSQLRSIFGDSLKGAKVHPPPYRPPPMNSGRAPITSYHLGAGDAFSRKSSGAPRRVSNGNSYGEESYV